MKDDKPILRTGDYGIQFEELNSLIATLRSPEGCPWDREQTEQTMKKYVLEEAQEVFDAIVEEDQSHICEELGDLLLQIIFIAQIYSEKNSFDIGDVIRGIHTKLVNRHPHVFGEEKASTSQEVLVNWQKIKAGEKLQKAEKKKGGE